MEIPPIETVTAWVLHEKAFPFKCGQYFEFQREISTSLDTMCAFLNSGGGYLLLGISENGAIEGISNMTTKQFDCFCLGVDSITRARNILSTNGNSLKPRNIIVSQVVRKSSKSIVIVQIAPDEGAEYQKSDGIIFHRVGPSNFKVSTSKMLTVQEVDRRIQEENRRTKSEYDGLLNAMKIELALIEEEKDKMIKMLHSKILAEKSKVEEELKRTAAVNVPIFGMSWFCFGEGTPMVSPEEVSKAQPPPPLSLSTAPAVARSISSPSTSVRASSTIVNFTIRSAASPISSTALSSAFMAAGDGLVDERGKAER